MYNSDLLLEMCPNMSQHTGSFGLSSMCVHFGLVGLSFKRRVSLPDHFHSTLGEKCVELVDDLLCCGIVSSILSLNILSRVVMQ